MHATTSRKLLVRSAIAFALVLAAGCAPMRVITPQPSGGAPEGVPEGPRYEMTRGQDPATVASLRAAPAPRTPDVAAGGSGGSDERVLNARGFVRIGSGWYPGSLEDARHWAHLQGEHVGADKALVYAAGPVAPGAKPEQRIDFYVRYRLPFGATFRSLTEEERKALDSGGVQLGDVVSGTPASEANLQRGDFVVKFNGEPVADRAAFAQMLRKHMGQRVTLTIRREGFTVQRLVRLGVAAHGAAED